MLPEQKHCQIGWASSFLARPPRSHSFARRCRGKRFDDDLDSGPVQLSIRRLAEESVGYARWSFRQRLLLACDRSSSVTQRQIDTIRVRDVVIDLLHRSVRATAGCLVCCICADVGEPDGCHVLAFLSSIRSRRRGVWLSRIQGQGKSDSIRVCCKT